MSTDPPDLKAIFDSAIEVNAASPPLPPGSSTNFCKPTAGGNALFDMESVLMDSPRLTWIKKHNAVTHFAKHCTEAPWTAAFRQELQEKMNAAEVIMDALEDNGEHGVGFGKTEDEALTNLAINWNVRLWNEEK
jgi:hypothetical protein